MYVGGCENLPPSQSKRHRPKCCESKRASTGESKHKKASFFFREGAHGRSLFEKIKHKNKQRAALQKTSFGNPGPRGYSKLGSRCYAKTNPSPSRSPPKLLRETSPAKRHWETNPALWGDMGKQAQQNFLKRAHKGGPYLKK